MIPIRVIHLPTFMEVGGFWERSGQNKLVEEPQVFLFERKLYKIGQKDIFEEALTEWESGRHSGHDKLRHQWPEYTDKFKVN